MKITKRDGTLVSFEPHRISNAIARALRSDSVDLPVEKINKLTDLVVESLKEPVTVEMVQDKVEETLMKKGYFSTARKYIIYRNQRAKIRSKVSSQELSKLVKECSVYFEHDPMREFVYYRTYSRWLETKNRREVWVETVDRYMQFMREQLGSKLDETEYSEVKSAILKQEVMPSMRLLQFAGPAAKRCNVCIYNCAYTAPKSLRDIVEIMYISMSGVGCGWSVEAKNVEQLPAIKKQKVPLVVHRHVVGDSKEGWCDSYLFGLEKWFEGEDVSFDYSKVRPAGARLKTLGGRSSGPQSLIDLMDFSRRLILSRQGSKLKPIDVYDVICMIGMIVITGGTRRTAMISLSDFSDMEIRDAKKGAFWNTHPHRAMANNSAIYLEKPSMCEFMEEWLSLAKSGTGERGIFNRGGLKYVLPERRMKLLKEYDSIGCNPCGEIILSSKEFCNLSEVVCRHDDSQESLLAKARIATIIGTYQSSLTNFNYLSPEWRKNQEAERLLGVSLTGQWDCPAVQQPETLQKLKAYCIQINREYAERFGINPSTAITTVKPSGSVSQMVNSSSGMHPRFSPYYIRRIRIAASDPLLKLMRDQGYPCSPEVGQQEDSATTFVLDFPNKAPEGCISAKDVSALQQLEYWKKVRTNYTEHNCSVTIYIKDNEWLEVGQWIWNNWDYVCGLAFLPYSDHIYRLAPYETITKEQYEEMVSKLPAVDFSKLVYYESEDNTDLKKQAACIGDRCEL